MKNFGHSPDIDQKIADVHSFMLVLAPALVLRVPDAGFAETTAQFSKELAAQLESFRREATKAAQA